jgi:hypothetical protein
VKVFIILPGVDELPEFWRHVQRLQETVHVTGSALVSKSDIFVCPLRRLQIFDVLLSVFNFVAAKRIVISRLSSLLSGDDNDVIIAKFVFNDSSIGQRLAGRVFSFHIQLFELFSAMCL